MYSKNAPFRYDFVGSFLRPAPIKAARAAFAAGELDAAGLKEVEDREIRKLISRQKAAGYHTITDGEFRRSYWHLDFMWGLQGLQEITLDHGYIFHGEETTPGSVRLSCMQSCSGRITARPPGRFIRTMTHCFPILPPRIAR